MSILAKAAAVAVIVLIAIAGCQDAQQESASAPPTATLRPATQPPVPPATTAVDPSTPTATLTPPPATPTTGSTPLPAPTATPVATEPPTGTPAPTPTHAPPAIPFPDLPPELGSTLTRPIDNMVMVYVPAGAFEMGSLPDDDRFGPHTVTLDAFWIDQTQVTNAQFAAFLNDQGNQVVDGYTWMEVEQMANCQVEWVGGVFRPEAGKETHPVVEVSWNGSDAYCRWVGGRLPTEAEWEYAARGPENRIYPWGDQDPTCELSQFGGCGDFTVPVGSLSEAGASWAGARDMAGNVWEWVADNYGEYPSGLQTNPTGPETGETKVARGGSFMSAPDTLHTAYRLQGPRTYCQPNFGFRCAASVPGFSSASLAATSDPPAGMSIDEVVTSLQGLPLAVHPMPHQTGRPRSECWSGWQPAVHDFRGKSGGHGQSDGG